MTTENTCNPEFDHLLSSAFLPEKKQVIPYGKKKKILVIAGPTATGKTRLGISLAKAIGGEIISADSMQVFRGMDIGTAKVTEKESEGVVHHLINIRDISETFNVMDFYQEAHRLTRDILSRGKVPILVGGTGFYLHAYLYGPPAGPPSVPGVRARLESQMEQLGPIEMYHRLEMLDPEYAKTITANDRHKIIRALEIITISEKKVSDMPVQSKPVHDQYRFFCWFIYLPKESLYPRIEARCDQMIKNGLIEEVKRLEKEGLEMNHSASQAIGYRQTLDYLETKCTEEDRQEFLNKFKQASRRYAKRQFTWFKKEPMFRWFNIQEKDPELVKEIILHDFEQTP